MATTSRSRSAPARRADPFLTLYVSAEWAMQHCVVPDGDMRGEPFIFSDDQLGFWGSFYRVKVRARNGQRNTAFVYRRAQYVRPQKHGKSPLIAVFICNEGVGPALFAGFAKGGEQWVCAEHGCSCGWVYEYEPGEPMGRSWPTPLIQITAYSEDQTDNTYDALRPMIELGPLAEQIPKTGEEFIRLPHGGYIDVVTSKAQSRLGQRVTFVPQDETGLWTPGSGMVATARTQRRGLAGMGGRSIETTNAWDPSQDSVAQRTHESKAPDILKDWLQPPAELNFLKKPERRKMFVFLYASSPWVDLDSIEADTVEAIERDPGEAERFYGNRSVNSGGHVPYLAAAAWAKKQAPERYIAPGTQIVLGFDGSDVEDWTALRAETLDGYQFTPTFGDGQPTIWNPADHGGQVPRLEVDAAVDELFDTFEVKLMYGDPPLWQTELDNWAARHGDTVVRRFETYALVKMHAALERMHTDVTKPSGFTHDGCATTAAHMANARRSPRKGLSIGTDGKPISRYFIVKASIPQKIDAAMASVLAHEAAGDALAAGLGEEESYVYVR